MIHEFSDFVTRPTVAIATSFASVIVSLLPHLESGMRLGTLFCGLMIAGIALRKTWRDRNK
jgi:GTP-sensing pleiotropic transcriptional regulator CodY